MIVWIDATRSGSQIHVFGMTLLERLLRGLVNTGVEVDEVRVALSKGEGAQSSIPDDVTAALPLVWESSGEALAQRFDRAVADAGDGGVIAVSADSVVDTRLLSHFLKASGGLVFRSGEGDERCALLRVEAAGPGAPSPDSASPDSPASDCALPDLADRALSRGAAKDFSPSDFDGYVRKLRREFPPYLFRIPDEARRDRVERFLFWSNYKGSTDFLTKYVYPPLVWLAVRPLARRRVHPNWVTAASYVATFASVPLFVAGWWISGLTLAYVMSVLDSVDGKLARLTFTSSRFGDVFDHGLDLVHPPIWYMAWALGLSGGDFNSHLFVASLWLLGLYVIDRLCAPIFKYRTGRSIHGYTPLDERMRTFISRRNVNLAAFTVALLVDAAIGAEGNPVAAFTFYAIVGWQFLSFIWHAERVVKFWNDPPAR